MVRREQVSAGAWATLAAFGTYFCMHGFRKPFTAGSWQGDPIGPWELKSALVSAHILGYMTAKVLGVRFVSQLGRHHRAAATGMLLIAAHASLMLFALLPSEWGILCMYVNGLSLGLIFGLVIGFLEGRQLTEAMAAGLCASFIIAGGVSKSVGQWVLEQGVDERWMPFVAGTLFVAPTAMFLWMLAVTPPPAPEDVAHRSERPEMTAADRKRFVTSYWPGLFSLFAVFLLVTVVRSYRDDFAPELWRGLGVTIRPALYTWTDTLIAATVLIVLANGVWIRDNAKAFRVSLVLSGAGLVLAIAAIVGWYAGKVRGIPVMLLVGSGLYLPYVAMHTTVFERLIAATRARANVGFCIYFADAVGYVGYIALMLARPVLQTHAAPDDFLRYFAGAVVLSSGLGIVFLAISWRCFGRAGLTETNPVTRGDSSSGSRGK